MTDDFTNHPQSVTEIRAHKSQCPSDWTPRDALIEALRGIDSGQIKPEAMVIIWRSRDEGGHFCTQFNVATPDLHVTLGLLARAAQLVVKE